MSALISPEDPSPARGAKYADAVKAIETFNGLMHYANSLGGEIGVPLSVRYRIAVEAVELVNAEVEKWLNTPFEPRSGV